MPQLFVTRQHWPLPVWGCCAQQCKVQWWPVTSSIPWGSILGPALFNVFINGEQPNLSKLGTLCKHGWQSRGKGCWKQHGWRSHCADQRRQEQTQTPGVGQPLHQEGLGLTKWKWHCRNGHVGSARGKTYDESAAHACAAKVSCMLGCRLAPAGQGKWRTCESAPAFMAWYHTLTHLSKPRKTHAQRPRGKDENQAQPQGSSQREMLLLPPASSWAGEEKIEPDAFCGVIMRGISHSWWTGNSKEQRKKNTTTTLWKSWPLEQCPAKPLNLHPQTQPSRTSWTDLAAPALSCGEGRITLWFTLGFCAQISSRWSLFQMRVLTYTLSSSR